MKTLRMGIVAKFKDNNYDSVSCFWNRFEFVYHIDENKTISIPFNFDKWSTKVVKKHGYIYIDSISSNDDMGSYHISDNYIQEITNAGIDPDSLDSTFMSSNIESIKMIDYNIILDSKFSVKKFIPENPKLDLISISFIGDNQIPLYMSRDIINNYKSNVE